MPKSYLANEPACQRAELYVFDPYVQVAARLQARFIRYQLTKWELLLRAWWYLERLSGGLPVLVYHELFLRSMSGPTLLAIQERLDWYTSFGFAETQKRLSSLLLKSAEDLEDTATYATRFS